MLRWVLLVATSTPAWADPAVQQLTHWIGFRVDARYLRAFGGDYVTDYGWLRISAGVTVEFPR